MKATNANLFYYIMLNQPIYNKLINLFKTSTFKDYVGKESGVDLKQALRYESINDLEYLNLCYQETLRIEPPNVYSPFLRFTQDQKLGEFNVRKDDFIVVNIQQIHHLDD